MASANQLQVMVVDDQATMRSLVRECLVQMGCRQVVECEDGREALDKLEYSTPHLIISDLNMPRMDGLALLKAVRADRRLKAVGFIMVTSRAEIEMVRQAVALGVNNYLVKPFSLGDFRKKVEAVVGVLT